MEMAMMWLLQQLGADEVAAGTMMMKMTMTMMEDKYFMCEQKVGCDEEAGMSREEQKEAHRQRMEDMER